MTEGDAVVWEEEDLGADEVEQGGTGVLPRPATHVGPRGGASGGEGSSLGRNLLPRASGRLAAGEGHGVRVAAGGWRRAGVAAGSLGGGSLQFSLNS